MQVSCVYKLRQALGLDKPGTPVKVNEPIRCSARSLPICKMRSGSTRSASAAEHHVGFPLTDWKPWTTTTARLCSCRAASIPSPSPTATSSCIRGRQISAAQRSDAQGRVLLRLDHPQEPIDDDKLNVEDNLEEFGPVSDAALQYFATEPIVCGGKAIRAIVANFGGSAFGDIALVPGPWLKHPKGIRDVAEWYMSTVARFDYVHESSVASATSPCKNFAKYYDAIGDRISSCLSPAPILARRTGRLWGPPLTGSFFSRSIAA